MSYPPGTEKRPADPGKLVSSRLAQSLHCQQQHFQSGRLGGIGATDVRPAESVRHRRCLGCPFLCQGFYYPGRHSAQLRCPFGGLGDTVFFAQDVFFELVKTISVGGDILLIVGPIGNPLVGDGQLQRGISIGQYGYPLIAVNSRPVI